MLLKASYDIFYGLIILLIVLLPYVTIFLIYYRKIHWLLSLHHPEVYYFLWRLLYCFLILKISLKYLSKSLKFRFASTPFGENLTTFLYKFFSVHILLIFPFCFY